MNAVKTKHKTEVRGGRLVTPRQAELYDRVAAAPGITYRELAALMGLTINGLVCKIEALREKGLITWDRGEHRTLRVVS